MYILTENNLETWSASKKLTYGNGDTSYAWVSLLILFLIALISTALWSLLERNRNILTITE